jgi:hypothetical protein
LIASRERTTEMIDVHLVLDACDEASPIDVTVKDPFAA